MKEQTATSFEMLYRRHSSALFRFAWGLCGDPHEAEDILSETFVRLLIKAPRIKTKTALAYLLAVARNTYLSRKRQKWREVPISDNDLYASPDNPVRMLESQAHFQATLRALRGLSEGERSALLLRADHNLPYEDIAASLGTTVGAAKVRVHRARMRLSEELTKEGFHDEVRKFSKCD